MLLESCFKTYDAYFYELLLFLKNVSWLFDFPVTQMLSQDIFSKVPADWETPLLGLSLSNDELNLFPSGLVKDDWPSSLFNFQEQCKRLTLPVLSGGSVNESHVSCKDAPKEIWRGMTPKKKIEVELLSTLVHRECQSLGISKILDVGSGHGYVDRLLLMRGYTILGFETNLKMIKYTITQLEKTFSNSLSRKFKYIQMNIDSNSFHSVQEAIRQYMNTLNQTESKDKNSLCSHNVTEEYKSHCTENYTRKTFLDNISMIGLHACGDLAVNSMKLFLNLPEVKSLIMVPCCYHKMLTVNGVRNEDSYLNKVSYCNFPLSKTLKDTIAALGSPSFLQGPFLRLAGQATNSLWQNCSKEEHENHAFHVLSRAIVQLYCVKEGRRIEKCFRRTVKKSELDKNNFSVYVEETLERCTFSSINEPARNNEDVEQIRQKLLKLWEQHRDKMKLVEVITGLQMRVESVAESLIAADRICFLLENGIKDVRLVKLFDSSISPRGLVYLASKTIKSLQT